jgi:hypothetical protein
MNEVKALLIDPSVVTTNLELYRLVEDSDKATRPRDVWLEQASNLVSIHINAEGKTLKKIASTIVKHLEKNGLSVDADQMVVTLENKEPENAESTTQENLDFSSKGRIDGRNSRNTRSS